jgi:uncharacterized protein (DUF1778 family)
MWHPDQGDQMTEKRTNRLTILLRPDERHRIRQAAEALHLSQSDFARMTLLQRAKELVSEQCGHQQLTRDEQHPKSQA